MNFKSKKAILLGAIVSLFPLLNLAPVHAEDGLRIVSSSAQASFPLTISFSIAAESDVDITDIRLHYKVLRHSFADVTAEVYLQFVSALEVEASWDWDMRRTGGLPPSTGIQYWWTVKDAGGDQIETSPVIVWFDDERFSWQSLTQDMVTLYWYNGDMPFAEELMLAIEDALDWLEADTGAIPQEAIEIYIYATSQDLRGAMIFPREWTGGVAYTAYGRIAIGIGLDNLDWGKRALTHELTHLVVHQMTLNPYSDIPTWLDEGLAMRSEGSLTYYYVNALNQAIGNDSLISVQSISSPFSALTDLAILSYAESYSVVDYLITTHGKNKMLELLETFREGASYDGALMEVYRFDTSGLYRRWCEYLSVPVEPVEPEEKVVVMVNEVSRMHPAFVVTLAGLATVFLVLLSLVAENWTWRRAL
ncbi:MAG TPA: peptidase MA domain-containing protein [Dehalococcoidia bacterium]|nr:peptidase MA domain-containing protein [Dehalococcoidia bacterium]